MDEETRTLSFAHKEGQRAYSHAKINGRCVVPSTNPFLSNPMEAWAWDLGFREQEFLDAYTG